MLPVKLRLEEHRTSRNGEEQLGMFIYQADKVLFVVDDGVDQNILLNACDAGEINLLKTHPVKQIDVAAVGCKKVFPILAGMFRDPPLQAAQFSDGTAAPFPKGEKLFNGVRPHLAGNGT